MKRNGFWRRPTSALPGSVKPVESKTGATNLVIGAQYSYNDMLSNVNSEGLSNNSNNKVGDLSNQENSQEPSKSDFFEFLTETNDDWNDKSDEEDLSTERNLKNKEVSSLSSLNNNNTDNDKEKSNDSSDSIAERLTLNDNQTSNVKNEIAEIGYLPCNTDRRVTTLARKRKEYIDSVSQAYARGIEGLDHIIWHQIHIDVPRTNPGIPLYQYETTQQCLERILYVWAIRHPASGYVQDDDNPENYDPGNLPKEVLNVIEADSFWCLSKLLDGIQDNYTFAQPPLAAHLQDEGVEFIQLAFRWMNCLLMREMSLRNTIRMWDTYLAEGPDGFSEFHLYVCAAFLVKWSEKLRRKSSTKKEIRLAKQNSTISRECRPDKCFWYRKEEINDQALAMQI
ncbi:8354_t:CDS:10 [Entrophospora sp. SA101]|nr:13206_t:CDS:10 [Entrophospora sp. SA101]CAJ0906273.1 8354_t:CDS:10 [Entrophospora sp. SA101]